MNENRLTNSKELKLTKSSSEGKVKKTEKEPETLNSNKNIKSRKTMILKSKILKVPKRGNMDKSNHFSFVTFSNFSSLLEQLSNSSSSKETQPQTGALKVRKTQIIDLGMLNELPKSVNSNKAFTRLLRLIDKKSKEAKPRTKPRGKINAKKRKKKSQLLQALVYANKSLFLKPCLLKILIVSIDLGVFYLLNLYVRWLIGGDSDSVRAFVHLFAIIILRFFKTCLNHHFIASRISVGAYIELTLRKFLGKKITNLSVSSYKHLQVSLLAHSLKREVIEVAKFGEVMVSIIGDIMFLAVIFVIIFMKIKWIGLLAPILIVMGLTLKRRYKIQISRIREELKKISKERVGAVLEAIKNILTVKHCAWEEFMLSKIQIFRNMERRILRRLIYTVTVSSGVLSIAVGLTHLSSAWLYYDMEKDARKWDTLVLMIGSLYLVTPLNNLLKYFNIYDSSRRACLEIEKYSKFSPKDMSRKPLELEIGSVYIKSGYFTWLKEKNEKKNQFSRSSTGDIESFAQEERQTLEDYALKKYKGCVLHDINLKINPKEFITIIGKEASGKTSMLLSIIGELESMKGKIKVSGKVAYISQTPYIFKGSILENIVFDEPFNSKWYNKVLNLTRLTKIVHSLPYKSSTAIGGPLSGNSAQKRFNIDFLHRVCIARALYSKADIYIVDDILQTMESDLRSAIFEEVFQTFLSDKTIIMATTLIQILPKTNRTVLMRSGRVVCEGHFNLIKENEDFADFLDYVRDNELSVGSEYYYERCELKHTLSVIEEEAPSQQSILYFNPGRVENPMHKLKDLYGNIKGDDFTPRPCKIDSPREGNSESVEMGLSDFAQNEIENPSELHEAEEQEKPSFSDLDKAASNSSFDGLSKAGSQRRALKSEESTIRRSGTPRLSRMTSIQTRKMLKNSGCCGSAQMAYLKTPGAFIPLLGLIIYQITALGILVMAWLIFEWKSPGEKLTESIAPKWIYIILLGAAVLQIYLKSYLSSTTSSKNSYSLFNSVLKTLLKKPISFHRSRKAEKLNKLMKSTAENLDLDLPQYLVICLDQLVMVMAILLLFTVLCPLFGILVFFVFCFGLAAVRKYSIAMVYLKRLTTSLESVVYFRPFDIIRGATVLRSYSKPELVLDIYFREIELLCNAKLHQRKSYLWVAARIDYWVQTFLLIVLLVFAGNKYQRIVILDSENVMLVVIYWMFVLELITKPLIDSFGRTLTNFRNLDHLQQFTRDPDQEAEWKLLSDDPLWPRYGRISLNNLKIRYSSSKKLALKGISLTIRPRTKMVIVGSPGSGKTTVLLSLIRIVDFRKIHQNEDLAIEIDGLGVDQVGLHALRRSVCMIPTHPQLFQGTLRYNLDPMKEHTDDTILSVLDKVELIDTLYDLDSTKKPSSSQLFFERQNSDLNNYVAYSPPRPSRRNVLRRASSSSSRNDFSILEFRVDVGGTNLSEGQKRLICLARALLCEPRIVLIDEPNPEVDEKTELMIQKLVTKKMGNTTVVSVSNHFKTIVDYNKVLVLKDGSCAGFGVPYKLIQQDGHFSDLLRQQGGDIQKEVKAQAKRKYARRRTMRNNGINSDSEEEESHDSNKLKEKSLIFDRLNI